MYDRQQIEGSNAPLYCAAFWDIYGYICMTGNKLKGVMHHCIVQHFGTYMYDRQQIEGSNAPLYCAAFWDIYGYICMTGNKLKGVMHHCIVQHFGTYMATYV